MKKGTLAKNLRKILFVVGCVVLAFIFWFIVEYSQLATMTGSLNIC